MIFGASMRNAFCILNEAWFGIIIKWNLTQNQYNQKQSKSRTQSKSLESIKLNRNQYNRKRLKKRTQSKTIESIEHNRSQSNQSTPQKNVKIRLTFDCRIHSKINRIDWHSIGFDWFDWQSNFDCVRLITPGLNTV